jgi:hypothetical protein
MARHDSRKVAAGEARLCPQDERRPMQLVRGRGRYRRGLPRVRARGRAQGGLLPSRARRALGHPGCPLGARHDPAAGRARRRPGPLRALRRPAGRPAASCSSATAASTGSPTPSAASTTCCSGPRPGGAGRRRARVWSPRGRVARRSRALTGITEGREPPRRGAGPPRSCALWGATAVFAPWRRLRGALPRQDIRVKSPTP